MKNLLAALALFPLTLLAQKKPLDHSVYDGWQSVNEKLISPDGKWAVYTVNPQEGDGTLVVHSLSGNGMKKEIGRGYNAVITEDSRYVIFRIKPFYKETREARIKKKRAEDLPKDSVGILEFGKDSVIRMAKIRTFKTPEKASGWVAFHKERDPAAPRTTAAPTQKTVDSLKKTIDSLVMLVNQIKNIKAGNKDAIDADEEPGTAGSSREGSDLMLRNLQTGQDRTFRNVAEYLFEPKGKLLLMKVARAARDSASINGVVVFHLAKGTADTILKGGYEFKGFNFSDDGNKIAFVADRDTSTKSLQKFYGLYLYTIGKDSAVLIADRTSAGMPAGFTVSEYANPNFSKSGGRLMFGTAPVMPPKDTTLIDIDLVKLDIWNYKDDYLQTQQLNQLNSELRRTNLAVFDLNTGKMTQLGSKEFTSVIPMGEGEAEYFIASTDTGRRVASQWAGRTNRDVYVINVKTGALTLIKKNHSGQVYPSSTGKYIVLYDAATKNYFSWSGSGLKNISAGIKHPLYNEENDVPDEPSPYGIMGWHEGDSAVYVYDRYDVWKVDPNGVALPQNITRTGRSTKNNYRFQRMDREEKFLSFNQPVLFKIQNRDTKQTGMVYGTLSNIGSARPLFFGMHNYSFAAKASNAPAILYTRENYIESPDLYAFLRADRDPSGQTSVSSVSQVKLSSINAQQAEYNWGTAELYKWKTFDGKTSEGILYKPEDFDSTKKYPMLIYFYEKVSNGLYNYTAPAPTPSRLNIPFFVSRGYIVFAPDISYTKGQPGKDAYNYIVSGAQALGKKSWVDEKNIGIQGQSWGGYQVAHLITATNMFKAAWAGAPVVNMFSAYGGIRWESGNNRQFQYEKGQSRIGATPWERPDLYIENSPFFHLKKVQTPLVIMANDADGAVPWYQGIEFFTAMRRLGKPVWMLNYNGEAHNLVERKNRKDIQIREQQFFDWLLKGEKPAKWITEGVPAVMKGKDWGLAID
jgi:dipeptidyl aminopeptidase/acylaminoacyl peptidase